jgi:hypothetical protein
MTVDFDSERRAQHLFRMRLGFRPEARVGLESWAAP